MATPLRGGWGIKAGPLWKKRFFFSKFCLNSNKDPMAIKLKLSKALMDWPIVEELFLAASLSVPENF